MHTKCNCKCAHVTPTVPTIKLMLFVRPTRGYGGRHRIKIKIKIIFLYILRTALAIRLEFLFEAMLFVQDWEKNVWQSYRIIKKTYGGIAILIGLQNKLKIVRFS